MKPLRFLLLVLGVFALIGTLYLGAFFVALRQPVWPYHWLRNVYLVKDRMVMEARPSRCLILGGSSAWFGFQSGLIEKATGLQVINLGMHAELPLSFQLWQAERHLRRGDTVLLADELEYYWPRENPYTTYAATEIVLMAPEFWWQTTWRGKYDLIQAVPPVRIAAGLTAWLARGTAAYADKLALPSASQLMENFHAQWAGTYGGKMPSHYNYLELDRHGDNVRPRQQAIHSHDGYGLADTHAVATEVWRQLAEFARRMDARGVRCLGTWPPFERHPGVDFGSVQTRTNLAFIRAHLSAAGWRVVGEAEDGAMSPEFFYDTPYHLTTEGAWRRTERLVERLKAAGLAAP